MLNDQDDGFEITMVVRQHSSTTFGILDVGLHSNETEHTQIYQW